MPVSRRNDPYEIVVVGQPSSGTRLITRLVAASGLRVKHDNRHGKQFLPGKIVRVKRDEGARLQSALARWPQEFVDKFPSSDDLDSLYPSAYVVNYEDVVADKQMVIRGLAAHFGLAPWVFEEEVFNANAEAGSREPAVTPPVNQNVSAEERMAVADQRVAERILARV